MGCIGGNNSCVQGKCTTQPACSSSCQPQTYNWKQIQIADVILDDYSSSERWSYSRISTNRGTMPDDFPIGRGSANVDATNGWRGVWTSLIHLNNDPSMLNSKFLLGPYVISQYQPSVSNIQFRLNNADKNTVIKVEIKTISDLTKPAEKSLIWNNSSVLSGGPETLIFMLNTPPSSTLWKTLNWVVEPKGRVEVDEIRLGVSLPKNYTLPEAVFLFSYAHLSQCYDHTEGIVRERASWPATDFANLSASGMFALATAVASELGYVEKPQARTIISKIASTILQSIPRHQSGILPHFASKIAGSWQNLPAKIIDGVTYPAGEWSTVDTAITAISLLLAMQGVGLSTADVEKLLAQIDWRVLLIQRDQKNCMGHGFSGDPGTPKLINCWDTFGSESLLVALAYAATTGQVPDLIYDKPPTSDGSGFNDELAALLFPMCGCDVWGNDWPIYRSSARAKQIQFFSAMPKYKQHGFFGLSASEVPSPWTIAPANRYVAWGIGGHHKKVNDGTGTIKYPIVAPHYAAMIMAEEPMAVEKMFESLIALSIFSPLNNTESVGIDATGTLHWNSLKGSWNLGMQALGAARALSAKNGYPIYTWSRQNTFLWNAYKKVMP
jgi:hypothetical protein